MNGRSIYLPTLGRKNVIAVALVLVLLLTAAQPTFAGNPNPNVVPPNAKPYGKTINQWTADWWRYVLSFPASSNPLADATGANCTVGQSGPVFYLVGTTGGPAVRNECVAPVGKSILFPIINVVCAVPEDGPTGDVIRTLCSAYEDHTDRTQVTVDGVDLQNVLANYRFPAPFFSFNGATPGIFSPLYEGPHAIAYSDGWWIMLHPLPPGPHKIHFSGHLSAPEAPFFTPDFTVDVTYNLTVK